MLNFWHGIRGYVAGAVAFISCPCHLPITLPLLISLTAGTFFSAWMARNVLLVGAALTVLFLGGLGLAFKWKGRDKPLLPGNPGGVPHVTLVTSSGCGTACGNARSVWLRARDHGDFNLEELDILSARGRRLAARHNLFSTPAAVVNDKVVVRGVPSLDRVLKVVRPPWAAGSSDPS